MLGPVNIRWFLTVSVTYRVLPHPTLLVFIQVVRDDMLLLLLERAIAISLI
jgi:hypothetical protein